MANLHIKNAKIIDSNSPFNGKVCDLIIENGIITQVGQNLSSTHPIITEKGLCVSIGWFDMQANFSDPGFEHREDVISGLKCAAKGGFTGVAVMPSTSPVIDSKSGVNYLLNKSDKNLVDLYPIGALSHQQKGENISEMYDMKLAGAVAFSDDKKSIQNPDLLTRALLYVKTFNGLIISYPNDRNLSKNGQMNEGKNSTMLGLKGIPSLAEELMISRDISLTEYTNSKLHFSPISTKKSVQLIRQAKAEKLNITCAVSAHQLLLDDTELQEFDSHYKVTPPLREKEDITALIEGIKTGAIDVIISDHTPLEEELKKREFDHATAGIIGLETAFGVLNTALHNHIKLNKIIALITTNPRAILQLEIPKMEEKAIANLTLFNPDTVWEVKSSDFQSKSKNTPFIGKKLKGKVIAIINNKQIEQFLN